VSASLSFYMSSNYVLGGSWRDLGVKDECCEMLLRRQDGMRLYEIKSCAADTESFRHVTDTALVMYPTASWLGPLRWWIPCVAQAAFATVARMMGRTPLMERYTPEAEWKKLQRLKTD